MVIFCLFFLTNINIQQTLVDVRQLVTVRTTLTRYLTNDIVSEKCRHAAAGCIDAGFELLYSASSERVSMVASLFEQYDAAPFAKTDGRHVLMIHSLHRLRRTGGSASMLPHPTDVLTSTDLAEQVRPIQSWLSLLQQRKGSQSSKGDGGSPMMAAAKKLIIGGGSSVIDVDASTEASALLASLYRHLCVLVGDRVDRTNSMGDATVLEMPMVDGIVFDPTDIIRGKIIVFFFICIES